MKTIYSIAAKVGGGGIGTTSMNAVRGLYRHALNPVVFCDNTTHKLRSLIPNLQSRATHASVVERFPYLDQAHQWYFKDYLHDLIVSLRMNKTGIFHGWNGHCLRSLVVAKKYGAVTVVERASSHPVTYEKRLSDEYQKWDIKLAPILPAVKDRLVKELELADFIATPSEFAAKSLIKNGIPERKLIRLPFGAAVFKDGGAVNRKAGNKFNALFVGQVGIRKGVPYLLKAWQQLNLKDAELFLLGEPEVGVENILRPYRADPSIHFTGYTDPDPYYRNADIFIFPSIEEGSALVTYEALAAGLPLITTYSAGSVVTDEEDGFLVPTGDSDALAERIRRLYDGHTLLDGMKQKALIKAARYTWDNYGDSLAAAYKKLV